MPNLNTRRTSGGRRHAGRAASVAAAVCALLLLAGCSERARERYDDAPRGATNDEAADVITMPDGFSNVAAKCDGANRVYVIYHDDEAYGSIAVAPNDPACR